MTTLEPIALDPEEPIKLAQIARPFGVRGEINCVSSLPEVINPADLLVGPMLVLPRRGELWQANVEHARRHKDRIILNIEGIETPEQVAEHRFSDLCLPRRVIPPLPEGWHWDHDLAGCVVSDAVYGDLGHVLELDLSSAQPQLVVKRPGGTRIRIPWVKAFGLKVDPSARRIAFTLPEGFPGVSD